MLLTQSEVHSVSLFLQLSFRTSFEGRKEGRKQTPWGWLRALSGCVGFGASNLIPTLINGQSPGCSQETLRPGTHYPHVTWAHVILRVQLGCERRFSIEFYGADSHFCHSAYVMWSHVELWSAHVSARLSHFCSRTHFVRRDLRVEWSSDFVISCLHKRHNSTIRTDSR